MDNSDVKGDNVSPPPSSSDLKAVSTVITESAPASNNESSPDKKIETKPENKTPEKRSSEASVKSATVEEAKAQETEPDAPIIVEESKAESKVGNETAEKICDDKMEVDDDLDDKITQERSKKFASGKDYYCWKCHREYINISCGHCERSYHFKCLPNDASLPTGTAVSNIPKKLLNSKVDYSSSPEYNKTPWTCSQCVIIKENEIFHNAPSSPTSSITSEKFEHLLKFALGTIKALAEPSFHTPVDLVQFPLYKDFILHPMDFFTIERNIRKGSYKCTASFLADIKWILHNCYIYNDPTHILTKNANLFWKVAKNEASEIEICPGCFENFYVFRDNSFTYTCSQFHTLVWARLKGHPFWPAKIFRIDFDAEKVDCRFFGAHDRAWVAFDAVFLISEDYPWPKNKGSKSKLDNAVKEMELYIKNVREKFGDAFKYSPSKTPFKPEPPAGWTPKTPHAAEIKSTEEKHAKGTSGKSVDDKEISAMAAKIADASSEDEDEKPLVIDAPPSEAAPAPTKGKGRTTAVKAAKVTPKPPAKVNSTEVGKKGGKTPASKPAAKRSAATSGLTSNDASAPKKRMTSIDHSINETASGITDTSTPGDSTVADVEKVSTSNQRQASKKSAPAITDESTVSKRKPSIGKKTPIAKGKNAQQTTPAAKSRGRGGKKKANELGEEDALSEETSPSVNVAKSTASVSSDQSKRKDKKKPPSSFSVTTTVTPAVKGGKGGKGSGKCLTPAEVPPESSSDSDCSIDEDAVASTGKGKKLLTNKKQSPRGAGASNASTGANLPGRKSSVGKKSSPASNKSPAIQSPSNNHTIASGESSQLKSLKEEIKTLKKQISSLKDELKKVKEATVSGAASSSVKKDASVSEAVINETKRKQWCAGCLREAQYFCCWNTSYCSYECQSTHWPEHMLVCQQSQANHTNNNNNSGSANSTSASTPPGKSAGKYTK